jgi:hypothetical protein
VNAVRLDLQV